MNHFELVSMPPADTIGKLPDYFFPPYITLAHMFHAPRGWLVRDRELTQFVLQYVVDGFAYYPVAGRHYETRRGDLLFHRPHERHSILPVDEVPYVCISIVFHFGMQPFPYDDLFRGNHLLGNYADHPVDKMLAQLVSHYRQPGLLHQILCQGLLMQIFAEAARWNENDDARSSSHSLNIPKLVLVKNYLHDHFNRDVQIKELEQVSGLSRNYLLALFRKHVGMSPKQYLTRLRVNKAKELAIQSNYTVSEIAERVGYSDVQTFGRMFKKKTGQTLTQFCSNLVYS
ncbi:helix-turn-helix domain-containing protein [Paenibacillus sp. HJGM_3]|uniref:helix-turn-helix domain-containing protein n=1 Tax=Paenibacillus sp. HJGM_3 TaxID=3379816 RepID=UPI00385CD1FF